MLDLLGYLQLYGKKRPIWFVTFFNSGVVIYGEEIHSSSPRRSATLFAFSTERHSHKKFNDQSLAQANRVRWLA